MGKKPLLAFNQVTVIAVMCIRWNCSQTACQQQDGYRPAIMQALGIKVRQLQIAKLGTPDCFGSFPKGEEPRSGTMMWPGESTKLMV